MSEVTLYMCGDTNREWYASDISRPNGTTPNFILKHLWFIELVQGIYYTERSLLVILK
jgi:hypothetical protein